MSSKATGLQMRDEKWRFKDENATARFISRSMVPESYLQTFRPNARAQVHFAHFFFH
jgi:hypothetical protein